MEEKYLPELMAEKDSLDPSFTHALRLVNQVLQSVYGRTGCFLLQPFQGPGNHSNHPCEHVQASSGLIHPTIACSSVLTLSDAADNS